LAFDPYFGLYLKRRLLNSNTLGSLSALLAYQAPTDGQLALLWSRRLFGEQELTLALSMRGSRSLSAANYSGAIATAELSYAIRAGSLGIRPEIILVMPVIGNYMTVSDLDSGKSAPLVTLGLT